MIRSMTGFGEAQGPIEGGQIRVQVKTVNHRFLNTSIRTPPGFDRVEPQLQAWVRDRLVRGHATVTITLESTAESGGTRGPVVDLQLARHYHGQLELVRGELGLDTPVDLASLLRFSDLFRAPESPAAAVADPAVLEPVVTEALDALIRMRDTEGERLFDDLSGRLDEILRQLDRVEQRAPERLHEERERLRARIEELLGDHRVDDERLAREVAYLAEKWDINEELVRFRSHVALFRETMAEDPGAPVGKRLSFVVQEMHREANTIGSKANDAEISHASVALKEEVERLREQVENVE
jgi:uncharacterized protein (TIGR00255 family)